MTELNENDIKAIIQQRREQIYKLYELQHLNVHPLYDPEYTQKNPTTFLCMYPDQATPTKLSKSFANYNKYDILCKSQQIAQQLNMLVVPAHILHWRRRQRFEHTYAHFKASDYTYIMLPQIELNQKEQRKFIDYLRNLDWHTTPRPSQIQTS